MSTIDESVVMQSECGSREIKSALLAKAVNCVAITWAILQLWTASPMQYSILSFLGLDKLIITSYENRIIHLSVALFMTYILFPGISGKNRSDPTILDKIFSISGVCAVLYAGIMRNEIAERAGIMTSLDVFFSGVGLLLLLEAARRAVGAPVAILAAMFVAYSYFGKYAPEVISHKGHSIKKILYHQWLSSEGVFGIALGVSADFVFMFVIFGAFLEKAGAGKFFIRLSFAIMGKYRAGAAKASILASALMGIVSGSSIATVVTVGMLTIPFMKKSGFSAEKAGAIQVSASVTGQLTPPVMGSAALIMAEFLNVDYVEVIKYAMLPSIIIYGTLLYLVHLEALNMGIGAPEIVGEKKTFYESISDFLSFIMKAIPAVIVPAIVINGLSLYNFKIPGLRHLPFPYAFLACSSFICLIYFFIIRLQVNMDLADDIDEQEGGPGKILAAGLHYTLPIFVLIWCLVVERLSASYSSFYAVSLMSLILFTQKPLKDFIRKEKICFFQSTKNALNDLKEIMIQSSNGILAVAVATSVSGIIVGSIAQTGLGGALTDVIEYIARGNILLTLIATGFMCIILGMGMPTTACYIITSSIMAPVIVALAKDANILIHMACAHLFVMYYGIMADVTPPVGLASYAAAAISRGDPIKTGIQGFKYNVRSMILPFVFIFKPAIMFIDIQDPWIAAFDICGAILGIILITAAMQGFLIVKSTKIESLFTCIVGFLLIWPTAATNIISPPFIAIEKSQDIFTTSSKDWSDKKFRLTVGDYKAKHRKKIIEITADKEDKNISLDNIFRKSGIFLEYDGQDYLIEEVSDEHRKKIDNDSFIREISIYRKKVSPVYTVTIAGIVQTVIIALQISKKRKKCIR